MTSIVPRGSLGRPAAAEAAFVLLGMTEPDRAIYELWLRHPAWPVQRIASEFGETAEAVETSRDRLVAMGLLIKDPAKPDRTLPVQPDVLVDRLIADIEAAAAQQRADLLNARAELSALLNAHLAERGECSPGGIERIAELPIALIRITELARAAEREILGMHICRSQPIGPAGSSGLPNLRPLRKGVRTCLIYQHEHLADTATLEHLQAMADEGASIRTIANPGICTVVIDRRVGVVTAVDGSGGETLIVRGTSIVRVLSDFFQHCWPLAQPLARTPEPGTVEADSLTERDRVILHLLSLGIKDDVIARQLGVSVRTIRRQISALFEKLGVTSRFQAGFQAVQRGWL